MIIRLFFVFSMMFLVVDNALAGKVVQIGGQDACRYYVDGVPQTKYCTTTGVSCKSDGTCTVTETGGRSAIYSGTVVTIRGGGAHATH